MSVNTSSVRLPLVVAALALLSRDTWGASRLEYRAVEGCASEPEFVRRVAARGGSFDEPGANDGVTVEASITRDDTAFRGVLRVRRNGVESNEREVSGDTCDEVVDALAVITAIALHPAEPPSPATPAPIVEPPARPPRTPPRANASHVWPTPFGPGNRDVEVSAGKLQFEGATSVTASGGAALGVVPVVMPRIDVTLTRANFITTPAGSSYMVGPAWRLQGALLGPGTIHSGGFSSVVTGQAVGLGPCFSPLYDTAGLALLFCLDLAVEVMNVETKNQAGEKTQSKNVGLGTIGFGADLTYNFSHFQVALRLAADAATSPISAERPDGSRLFQSSWPSGYAVLGIGGHF